MLREIQKHLRPVRSRLTLRRAATALAGGLVLGGWLAMVAGILTVFGGGAISGIAGLALLAILPAVALVAIYLRPASWQQAARAVDRHFQLQDRTGTALHLAEHPSGDSLDALQAEDALEHLRQINTQAAVQLNIPWQRMLGGIALCLLAAGLIAWGIVAPPSQVAIRPSETGDEVVEPAEPQHVVAIEVTPALARRSLDLISKSEGDDDADFFPSTDRELVNRYFDTLQADP